MFIQSLLLTLLTPFTALSLWMPTPTVVRSILPTSDHVKMEINSLGSSVVSITANIVAPQVGDDANNYLFDGLVATTGGVIDVPPTGGPYWYVPFDPSSIPLKLAPKEYTISCSCSVSGTCRVAGTFPLTVTKCDPGTTCGSTCIMHYKDNGVIIAAGPGVLLAANTIIFNGVTFY